MINEVILPNEVAVTAKVQCSDHAGLLKVFVCHFKGQLMHDFHETLLQLP